MISAKKSKFKESALGISADSITPQSSSPRRVRFTEIDEYNEFNTSKEALTPVNIDKVKFKKMNERENVCVAPHGSLSKPNYEDILRRVSVVISIVSFILTLCVSFFLLVYRWCINTYRSVRLDFREPHLTLTKPASSE